MSSAIWSSSERPISVRTVWVDGMRHAILSPDDPLLSAKTWRRRHWRQRVSSSKDGDRAAKTSFDNYLGKLQLNVAEETGRGESIYGCVRRQSAPPRDRQVYSSSSTDSSNEQSDPNDSSKTQSDSSRTKQQQSNSIAAVCPLDILSKRVLHWLDMPRKTDRDCLPLVSTPRQTTQQANVKRNSRRQFSASSQEGSCMKIVRPTSCLVMQQASLTGKYGDDRRQLSQANTRSQTANTIFLNPNEVNVRTVNRHVTSESLWTLSGKPQLHIFMPNFKPARCQLISSQESIVRE